jgi:hypothetical protein
MEGKIRGEIYVRVSTASKTKQADAATYVQNPEVQEEPLRELVTQRGWELFRVYSDRASGAAERRPGLDALMADARRGSFDVVVVWRFDRFARSVKQLVLDWKSFVHFTSISFLTRRHSTAVRPSARPCSRSLGRWRNWNGILSVSASSLGWTTPAETGPNPGNPWVDLSLRNGEGLSWREIARKLRVGGATVRRAYKEWQTAQAALNGDADSSDQRTTDLDHGSVAR